MNNKTCFIYSFEPKPCLHPGRQVAAAKQRAGPQVHLQPWIPANARAQGLLPVHLTVTAGLDSCVTKRNKGESSFA